MTFDWNKFFECGYFLGSPLFGKVWCLYENQEPLCSMERISSRGLVTLPREQGPRGSLGLTAGSTEFSQSNFFYRNNFNCDLQTPWMTGNAFFEFNLKEFFNSVLKFEMAKPNIIWHPKDKKLYEHIFNKIKLGISNHIIHKAVPFYKNIGNSEITKKNLIYFFHRLVHLVQNKHLFFYGFWDFKHHKFQLGASPELLFINKKNLITTIALAGTSLCPKKDFQTQKMQNEHDYVVYDLFSELEKYGEVKKYRENKIKFKNYFHKRTKFSVKCQSDPNFEDLLQSMHPSAAIGAYPRSGIEFLKKIEQEANIKRDFFAAPFGIYLKQKFMLCISAIRGIEWDKGELSISAGGGIVAESSLEEEWKEICLKIQSIKSIFGLT